MKIWKLKETHYGKEVLGSAIYFTSKAKTIFALQALAKEALSNDIKCISCSTEEDAHGRYEIFDYGYDKIFSQKNNRRITELTYDFGCAIGSYQVEKISVE